MRARDGDTVTITAGYRSATMSGKGFAGLANGGGEQLEMDDETPPTWQELALAFQHVEATKAEMKAAAERAKEAKLAHEIAVGDLQVLGRRMKHATTDPVTGEVL